MTAKNLNQEKVFSEKEEEEAKQSAPPLNDVEAASEGSQKTKALEEEIMQLRQENELLRQQIESLKDFN